MGLSRDRLRDKYPIFFAFNGEHTFLDNGAALAATKEERIRSIWPFLVKRVLDFQKTLKARERVNFDPEDVMTELWIELAEKDSRWTPDRGKYITFAGTIIDHALYAIRDRARTVQSPRNSGCRLKEYRAEEEAGTISPRRAKTANDIRRAAGEFEPIDGLDGKALSGPNEEVVEQEAKSLARDAVVQAIRGLRPIEAAVVGASHGLWGRPAKSIAEIAATSGRCPDGVKRIKSRAHAKIRKRLRELGHPAVAGNEGE